jgi:hypothetical protein
MKDAAAWSTGTGGAGVDRGIAERLGRQDSDCVNGSLGIGPDLELER